MLCSQAPLSPIERRHHYAPYESRSKREKGMIRHMTFIKRPLNTKSITFWRGPKRASSSLKCLSTPSGKCYVDTQQIPSTTKAPVRSQLNLDLNFANRKDYWRAGDLAYTFMETQLSTPWVHWLCDCALDNDQSALCVAKWEIHPWLRVVVPTMLPACQTAFLHRTTCRRARTQGSRN